MKTEITYELIEKLVRLRLKIWYRITFFKDFISVWEFKHYLYGHVTDIKYNKNIKYIKPQVADKILIFNSWGEKTQS